MSCFFFSSPLDSVLFSHFVCSVNCLKPSLNDVNLGPRIVLVPVVVIFVDFGQEVLWFQVLN